MAETGGRGIARELMDEPHVTGRRISVRRIRELVEGRGLHPEAVADQLELDVVEVYYALTYYHDHPDEMRAVERERGETIEAHREDAITGPDDLDP